MIAPRGDETIATRSGLVAVTRHAALSVYDRGGGAVCLSVWNYFTIAPRGNETVAKRRKRWRLLEVRNLEVNTQWDRGGWRGLPVGVELRYDRPAGR